jgi:hypothetical protein
VLPVTASWVGFWDAQHVDVGDRATMATSGVAEECAAGDVHSDDARVVGVGVVDAPPVGCRLIVAERGIDDRCEPGVVDAATVGGGVSGEEIVRQAQAVPILDDAALVGAVAGEADAGD